MDPFLPNPYESPNADSPVVGKGKFDGAHRGVPYLFMAVIAAAVAGIVTMTIMRSITYVPRPKDLRWAIGLAQVFLLFFIPTFAVSFAGAVLIFKAFAAGPIKGS